MSKKESDNAQFSKEHYGIIKDGYESFSEWRINNPETILLLEGAVLENITFDYSKANPQFAPEYVSYFDFGPCNLKNANIENCKFLWFNFENVDFSNSEINKVQFDSCSFEKVNFNNSQVSNTKFKGKSVLKKVYFENSIIERSTIIIGERLNFSHAHISDSLLLSIGNNNNFQRSIIKNTKFRSDNKQVKYYLFGNSTFQKSSFREYSVADAKFSETNLKGSEILNSEFKHCDFTNADLTNIDVDAKSEFSGSNFRDSKIDRYSLDCIDDRQIAKSAKVKMTITDDIATLRLLYGGWRRIVNTLSIFFFLSPYVFFLGKLWIYDHFFSGELDSQAAIGTLIGRYIVSGGMSLDGWDFRFLPIIFWLLAILFNSVRFALLIKTLSLEFLQKVRGGLPVKFSLDDPCLKYLKWRHLLYIAQLFFYFNIGLAISHTIYFLIKNASIPPLH